jgi:hypothetical protein
MRVSHDHGRPVGGELLIVLGVLIWLVVLGIWLALLLGARATGQTVSGNPMAAVLELLLGRATWPGGYANAMLALEAAFLIVGGWLAWQFHKHRGSQGAGQNN